MGGVRRLAVAESSSCLANAALRAQTNLSIASNIAVMICNVTSNNERMPPNEVIA
jgi:hypothetical protein